MDNACGICMQPAEQLFETAKDGVLACMKCQPLVPEVTLDDSQSSNENTNSRSESEGPFHCDLCNKTFSKPVQFQNHVRNHRAERRFVCTYCTKAFSQSNNLRAHLRIHTNERPYKCNECGKAFTQVTNLNNHIRLHTGERPYVCPEPGCNKAYAQVTNLNQHRKRHMAGAPVESSYECNICGSQFEQRNHMYAHRRAAHTDIAAPSKGAARPVHVCRVCDECFVTERRLLQHVALHLVHGTSSDEEQMIGGGDWKGPNKDVKRRRRRTCGRKQPPRQRECSEGVYKCVFEDCGKSFKEAFQHAEHLIGVHNLKIKTGYQKHVNTKEEKIKKSTVKTTNESVKEKKVMKFTPMKEETSKSPIKDEMFDMEVTEEPAAYARSTEKVKIIAPKCIR